MLQRNRTFETENASGSAIAVERPFNPLATGHASFGSNSKGFLISVAIHSLILVGLAAVPMLALPESLNRILNTANPESEPSDLKIIEEVVFAEVPSVSVGAGSQMGTSMAFSSAFRVEDFSDISIPQIDDSFTSSETSVSNEIKEAVGLSLSKKAVKGRTGVATTGASGAVDRITFEILKSVEERPTLVVWLFDRSGSLIRQRKEIRDRFDRIYDELGIVQKSPLGKYSKRDRDREPLLTSVVAFGQSVDLLTKQPTANLSEIRAAVDSIELDDSGIERSFSAIYLAADRYKLMRAPNGKLGPERNVMLIVVTDERGNDAQQLENTVNICQKFAMPVYVLGVPAPFGREFTYIKYVDPDTKFDQSPSWAEVDQGPESIFPERIQLGYEHNYHEEPFIDSGFGPYALSRLCYETGGIYFSIHPNRKTGQTIRDDQIDDFSSRLRQFFDPAIMDRYRPDYVSEGDYRKRMKESPLRQALIQASQFSRTGTSDAPDLNFIKRDEASFVNELSRAQQASARLEPRLAQLGDILAQGEKFRDQEVAPRWLASYDLSYGTLLAVKVRTEGYNLMLAKAKRGIRFETEKNNTWNLTPSSEISGSSRLEKEAEMARSLLKGVTEEHAGTPWAYLAKRELQIPLGWTWKESFTDLDPPRPNQGNNGTPRPPQNDRARMLEQPVRRPVPKL